MKIDWWNKEKLIIRVIISTNKRRARVAYMKIHDDTAVCDICPAGKACDNPKNLAIWGLTLADFCLELTERDEMIEFMRKNPDIFHGDYSDSIMSARELPWIKPSRSED